MPLTCGVPFVTSYESVLAKSLVHRLSHIDLNQGRCLCPRNVSVSFQKAVPIRRMPLKRISKTSNHHPLNRNSRLALIRSVLLIRLNGVRLESCERIVGGQRGGGPLVVRILLISGLRIALGIRGYIRNHAGRRIRLGRRPHPVMMDARRSNY